MREHAVEDIVEKPDGTHSTAKYRVLYDGQCEICQSCVSWLKALDHDSKTICLPISAEVLATVDSRLRMDECLRQLHVVTPEGEIRRVRITGQDQSKLDFTFSNEQLNVSVAQSLFTFHPPPGVQVVEAGQ